jgi:hypothetical protein
LLSRSPSFLVPQRLCRQTYAFIHTASTRALQ